MDTTTRSRRTRIALALAFTLGAAAGMPVQAGEPSLERVYKLLSTRRFVDLTHAFAPGIPHWKGFGDETVATLYTYEKDGFFAQQYCHVGQWGTHVDPPSHFHPGKKSVDQIDLKDMLMPLVVLDVHEQAASNPDYVIQSSDVAAWERRHGRIPEHAFVAMRTDWSKRWPDDAAMANKGPDGAFHYPGWSMEVLKLLYEDRRIAASGHETTDTDPGLATTVDNYALESWLLGTDHYQIELLANLDQVPEAGALVMVSFPKPQGGSGFPARVVAILP